MESVQSVMKEQCLAIKQVNVCQFVVKMLNLIHKIKDATVRKVSTP